MVKIRLFFPIELLKKEEYKFKDKSERESHINFPLKNLIKYYRLIRK